MDRNAYAELPAFTQRFFTWLTGVPLPGQQPLMVHTPYTFAAATLLKLVLGVSVSAYCTAYFSAELIPLLIVGWLLTAGASRTLISTVCHQCIHYRFSGSRPTDHFVGNIITLALFTQSLKDYKTDHITLHHQKAIFATANDPSAILLSEIGIRPGVSFRRLWLNLLLALVSPFFHGRFLLKRVSSQLATGGPFRRLAALAVLATIAALLYGQETRYFVITVYLIPCFFLYQCSVLLEFLSEHAWFTRADGYSSWGRFCGSPLPVARRSHAYFSLLWWSLKTIFYHLPVRLFVLPGDLPHHDYHHYCASDPQWMNSTYTRYRKVQEDGVQLAEIWGLHNAISHVFNRLSHRPDKAAVSGVVSTS